MAKKRATSPKTPKAAPAAVTVAETAVEVTTTKVTEVTVTRVATVAEAAQAVPAAAVPVAMHAPAAGTRDDHILTLEVRWEFRGNNQYPPQCVVTATSTGKTYQTAGRYATIEALVAQVLAAVGKAYPSQPFLSLGVSGTDIVSA